MSGVLSRVLRARIGDLNAPPAELLPEQPDVALASLMAEHWNSLLEKISHFGSAARDRVAHRQCHLSKL